MLKVWNKYASMAKRWAIETEHSGRKFRKPNNI